jgi:hypothetical protein
MLLLFIDRFAIKAEKHECVQIPIESAASTWTVISTLDATHHRARTTHTPKVRTIF